MHELGIALDIIELASARCGEARIVKITVEVGASSLVLPDALAFCWEVATEGTPADGAALEIVRTGGEALKVRSMEVE